MSDVGLYGFEIPHEFVQPTRDMVIIQIPFPPEKVGSIITPQSSRELLSYNVMAGRIVAMGPLAFQYKDGEGGLKRQDVNKGDWVLIRPMAGTMVTGGQIMVTSGWRYVSSFGDVIAVIPSDRMPDPATLVWEQNDENRAKPPKDAAKDHFNFEPAVREKTTYAD